MLPSLISLAFFTSFTHLLSPSSPSIIPLLSLSHTHNHTLFYTHYTVGNFKVHVVGGNVIMLQSVQSSGLWLAIHNNKCVDAKVGRQREGMVTEDIELVCEWVGK